VAADRLRDTDEEEAEVNMTPMLDIVFIMLIFFIVTATFVKQAGLEILRPEAQTAVEQKRVGVLVAIGPEGRVFMDNKEIDVREVRAAAEKLLAENPQGSIVIQADQKSKSGITLEVLEQLRLAGAPAVAIATEEN